MPDSEAGAGLKRAIVILPIIIVLLIIAALLIGLKQFRSYFEQEQPHTQSSSTASRVTETDDEQRLLMVVSPVSPLPADYRTDLVTVQEVKVDKLIKKDLEEMLAAAEKDHVSLRMVSGYISGEQQRELFQAEVSRLMEEKHLTQINAVEETEKSIPNENHSERQTGLVITFGTYLVTDFSKTEEYRWLIRNAVRYGFILRYPEGKEKSTGFIADPACFRYVGKENAIKIKTLNMTLEEYAAYLKARK